MSLSSQITRYMSLREPQAEALRIYEEIAEGRDFRSVSLDAVAGIAKEKAGQEIAFDTAFPSFCFALATGVGKTRLMGASIYHIWKTKGYRHFFILSPNLTIYEKLKAELSPSHPKYMFTGLSDFPQPVIYDGDNYIRFNPQVIELGDPAIVFIFNIGKIFTRTDTDFKFHAYNEYLGNSFSTMLQQMNDLVILMDESHRYRGEASLNAINHLKPVLGLEFTATPLQKQKNVLYKFDLAQSMGRFIKTPTVVTRTNLTTADEEEIEKLKISDGLTLHEMKKGRLLEYCHANNLPLVKPFVLISTRDTTHASAVRQMIESESFCEGHYKGKVIEIHSGNSKTESDINVERLLSVEHPTSTVEIVIHVNMLKEGWDVKNLYTIIPLRASISEILTEQTIGRGLRLPFGNITGDSDLDSLEIISHDNYTKLIEAAKNNPLFTIKQISETDLQPVKTVAISPKYTNIEKALERLSESNVPLFASHFNNKETLEHVVEQLVHEDIQKFEETRIEAEKAQGEQAKIEGVQTALDIPVGTAPQLEMPPAPDRESLTQQYREQLQDYADKYIDVPRIYLNLCPENKLDAFDVKVNVGPFELVEQRIVAHNLSSGEERLGENMEIMEVENPRAFLAARLIDAVEEFDAMNEKELALKLVDSYLAKLNIQPEIMPKIVHLYREPIIGDIYRQIEEHLHQETRQEVHVSKVPVRFPGYSKTILATGGTKHYSESVPPSEIKRTLFEGFSKTIYPSVAFDSTPEKDFAVLIEKDPSVLKWIRPPEGTIPIYHSGQSYTPDFIVETKDRKLLVEIKGKRDLVPAISEDVKSKARAAFRWAEQTSKNVEGKTWDYKLVPEDAVAPNRDLTFVLGYAVKIT